jgi:hypothetical protein
MNWKKGISVAIITGAALTAMVGCSQTGATGTAAVQPSAATQATDVPAEQTQSTTQPKAAPTRQMPPSGVSMNGTMAFPPSDNMTGTPPAAPAMDLTASAAKLGITETQLSEALGNTQQGFPDLAAAATKLSITEDALRQALGFSNNGTIPGGSPPGGTPPAGQGK